MLFFYNLKVFHRFVLNCLWILNLPGINQILWIFLCMYNFIANSSVKYHGASRWLSGKLLESRKIPWSININSLHHSCLENSLGQWSEWPTIHRVTKELGSLTYEIASATFFNLSFLHSIAFDLCLKSM